MPDPSLYDKFMELFKVKQIAPPPDIDFAMRRAAQLNDWDTVRMLYKMKYPNEATFIDGLIKSGFDVRPEVAPAPRVNGLIGSAAEITRRNNMREQMNKMVEDLRKSGFDAKIE